MSQTLKKQKIENPPIQTTIPDVQEIFYRAIRKKDYDLVKYLMTRGDFANHGIYGSKKALIIAAEMNDYNMIELLIENGTDVDTENYINGNTALHIAARNGEFEIVKLLVEKCANVNKEDDNLYTPLHEASTVDLFRDAYKKPKIVDYLIKNGAKVNAKSKHNETPISLAIHISTEVVEILIDNGVDCNEMFEDRSLLHDAIGDGNIEGVKLLLDKGANVNIQDEDGNTPLHQLLRSSGQESLEIAKVLFKKKADPNVRNKQGLTSLQDSVLWKDSIKRLKLLIDNGAYVDIEYPKGITILDHALINYNKDDKSLEKIRLLRYHTKLERKKKIYILLNERKHNKDSCFYEESLPFDMFKEIAKFILK